MDTTNKPAAGAPASKPAGAGGAARTAARPSRPARPGTHSSFGKPGAGGPGGRGGKSDGGRPRGGRSNFERPKPEFEQKILNIRRVTRVVSGGRRMSFAVAIALGDKKGSVGVGTGKAGDTSLAINKAVRSARKQMIKIKMTKNGSIPNEVGAKYGSAKVMIMPNRGKGLVSGSATRDILNLAGITNVTSKILSGSKNKLNIARVTIIALSKVATKRSVDTKPHAPEAAPALPRA